MGQSEQWSSKNVLLLYIICMLEGSTMCWSSFAQPCTQISTQTKITMHNIKNSLICVILLLVEVSGSSSPLTPTFVLHPSPYIYITNVYLLCRAATGWIRTPDYTYKCLFGRGLILSGQILSIWGRFCPDFELASKNFANLSGSVN
jgi:hypothetical protein